MMMNANFPPHERSHPGRGDPRYLYHDAAEYRDRGWSTIPLVGKQPALPSWKEYQSRRATLGEIAVWFGGPRPRYANVGIVTGRVSGLIVIDCDDTQDVTWWQEQYPTPLTVRTGSGGRHFYYRAPQIEIRNSIRLFGRKIDVRGEGGLVVAPPSVHPDTQQTYVWEPELREYHWEAIPYLQPAWLPAKSPPDHEVPNTRRGRIQNVRAYIQQIDAIAGQGGHATTFRVACLLRDAGLPPEECLAEMIQWNAHHARPAWTVSELLHKVQSSFSARTPALSPPPDDGMTVS